jgi:ferredoxin
MKVYVDNNKCIGCGRCTEICPQSFKLNKDGKSQVISTEDMPCIKKASDQCPMEAIRVDE